MRPALAVVSVTAVLVVVHVLFAQTPPEPPRPLPASVTGAATPPPAVVSPASGVQPQPATTAPIGRFQNLQSFPAETVQAVYAMRAGADWLFRMHQPSGRFFIGLDPTLRTPLDADHDLRQAFAAYALAEAAEFTGDERFAARANQAVLALLTQTKPDPADAACRVPTMPAERCNRVGFAAVLALAIDRLPAPDPKLTAQAEGLCAFLRKQCQPTGEVRYADDPKADPEGVNLYPGLAVQALMASHRARPDAGKRDAVARAVAHYRGVFKARPNALLAATLVPGFVEFYAQSNKDAAARDGVYELADWLCANQYTRTDARTPGWVGGFKPAAGEPGFESAMGVGALAAAVTLTRQAPDLVRFAKYRQATIDGLAFARRLQFTDESADHFEKSYRTRFLVGGVHLGPSDGAVRADATGHLVTAHLAYLRGGAAEAVR